MSFCAISASAESWIDLERDAWRQGEGMPLYDVVDRHNANTLYFCSSPAMPIDYPLITADNKSNYGVVILKNTFGEYYTYILINKPAGSNLSVYDIDDLGETGFIYKEDVNFCYWTLYYPTDTNTMWEVGQKTVSYPPRTGITYDYIIYSDFNIIDSSDILRYKSTPDSEFLYNVDANLTVKSSGVYGSVERYNNTVFNNNRYYFRTICIDSVYDPPTGYITGKSLNNLGVSNASILYEPNYRDLYLSNQFYIIGNYPIINTITSDTISNAFTDITLPLLPAYQSGALMYDKKYTCILLLSTEDNLFLNYANWTILATHNFIYSNGTVIDLGGYSNPNTPPTTGGSDLDVTTPAHDWAVNGSDVVVPDIDFISPDYKNPFDVSFLFFYPENGENKPTFYLQYCLIAIAICAVAYLLFGKS